MAVNPLARRRTGVRDSAGLGLAVLRSTHAPLVVLILASLIVAALAATVASKIGTIALDEIVLKQSAVHYTSGLPGSLFHDINARATSRLYSLLLAPLFAQYDGDTAVRIARVFNTVLFASASIPAYLLALRVVASRWLAAVAALLGMATPWLILTTVIYTENLAFPLFLWTLWAMERAIRRPGALRDLAALVFIALLMSTRTQFGILFVAYWLSIVLVGVLPVRRGSLVDALPMLRRRWLRRHPFSVALLALVGLYVVWLAAHGHLHARIQSIFGTYSEIQDRNHISSDMSLALLVEVVALSLGIGFLPAVAGIAWYARALRSRRGPAWILALVSVVTVGVSSVATMYAQGGYIGDRTEERYYFYAVPLLWIGAAAALRGPLVPTRRALAVAAGALMLLYAVIPFPVELLPQTGFLTPTLASIGHLGPQLIRDLGVAGLTLHDALFGLAAVGFAALAFVWRRRRWARIGLVVVVPALLQLALTVYVFDVARGKVHGVQARTAGNFAASGWVDRALAHGGEASWLNNQSADATAGDDHQRATIFWNDQLTSATQVPAIGLPEVQWPLAGLGVVDVGFDQRTGVLGRGAATGALVQAPSSPQLQIAGLRLSASPDAAFELIRTDVPAHARWAAVGLTPDGWLPEGRKAALLATAPAGRPALRVRLTLAAPKGGDRIAVIRLGDLRRTVHVKGGSETNVTLTPCTPAGGVVTGTLTGSPSAELSDGTPVTVRLERAEVGAAPGGCQR